MACPPPDNASVCRPRSVYLAQDTTYTYSVLSDDNGAFYRVQELCDGVPTDAFTDYDLDWVAYTAVGTVTGPTSGGGGGGDASATNQTTEIARLTSILGAVDGVETLLTAIDGHVDGIEGLLATTNASLTTIDGHVDGIETLLGTTNAEIGATNETSAAADNSTSGLNGLIKRLLARLTIFMGQLPTTLGPKTMVNSLAVTLASDQSTVIMKTLRSATATPTNVASAATTGTILASNANRLGASIHNDSTAILYLKMGTTASATSYTVQIAANGHYEVPFGYTGIIDGIWASANGNARVTEYT